MASNTERHRARLSIDVEPELQRRIKIAAAKRNLSVREYVINVLRHALAADESGETPNGEAARAWSSARSFARDRDSDEHQAHEVPVENDALESRPEFATFMAFLAESALSRPANLVDVASLTADDADLFAGVDPND